MKLPQYEQVRLQNAPLRLVIGQIRFTIMPRFEQKAFIAGFQEAIRAHYPRVSREASVSYQLSPVGINPNPGEILWKFSSRDNRWAVVVGESALTLESRAYSTMSEYLDRFTQILQAASKMLGITDRLRLGLRYINEIRYPHTETLAQWRTLFNPEFAGFDAASLLDGKIDHTLQEIQVNRPDGVIALRHGLLSGAIVTPLPQEQSAAGQFYLLDFDYYDLTECDLDIAATVKQMQDYNDLIYRYFRWTLSEMLFNYLEPVHD